MSDIINRGIIIINQNPNQNGVNVVGNVEGGVTLKSSTDVSKQNGDLNKGQPPYKEKGEGSISEPEQSAARAGQAKEPSMRKIPRKPLWIILCVLMILIFWGICLLFGIKPLSEPEVFIEAIKWLLQ